MAAEEIPGSREVQTFDWITVRAVSDSEFVAEEQNQLDEGEAEAIARPGWISTARAIAIPG